MGEKYDVTAFSKSKCNGKMKFPGTAKHEESRDS
jgi:hypothetical protein